MKTKSRNVRVPVDLWQDLQNLARVRRNSAAAQVRQAIVHHLQDVSIQETARMKSVEREQCADKQ